MLTQNQDACFSQNIFLKFFSFSVPVSIEARRHEQNQSCSLLFFARGSWYVAFHLKCSFLSCISWLPCRNLPLPDPNKVAADAAASTYTGLPWSTLALKFTCEASSSLAISLANLSRISFAKDSLFGASGLPAFFGAVAAGCSGKACKPKWLRELFAHRHAQRMHELTWGVPHSCQYNYPP